jgi:MFS transporter, FHS family, glucose/mannose:H+ symporter
MTNQSSSAAESFSGRWSVSSLVLGVGFGLTGAATVMLGVLLPTLSQKWGLRDDAAGFLLFLQFIGSSLGAILTGARRIRSLIGGYGLLVATAGSLAFAGMHLSFVLFFFFGLGLGMTMTTTSLLISDRYGDDRAAKLERLNFAWAAGATAGPLLFLPFLREPNLGPLFITFQGLFLLLLVWVVFRERQDEGGAPSTPVASRAQNSAARHILPALVVMAMCSVGVESALSGWLTTYSHRADSLGAGGASIAASLFWSGIVLSRLAFSTRLLAIVGRRRLLRALVWCVAPCVLLLVAAHHPASIRLTAALAGMCIGPLYPLLLSFILQRSPHGWVFAVAGVGSAFLPWLTGLFSSHFGSLRYGLIAPCGTAVLMIVLFSVGIRQADSSIPGSSLPH